MNLFLLNTIIEHNVNSLCDKHVIKMILETAQVLWATWHLHIGDLDFIEQQHGIKPYRKTHVNHPITIWVREHKNHYDYAVRYGLLLCHEYTRRYGKIHKTQAHLELLFWLGYPPQQIDVPPPKKAKPVIKATNDIPGDFLYFPMCFGKNPEPYIIRDDNNNVLGVESYRNYYKSKADKFNMAWKTEVPIWF